MTLRRQLLLLLFILLTVSCSWAVNDYFVSPSGNDLNNGTSAATAWRTIAHADAALALGTSSGAAIHNCGRDYGAWVGLTNVSTCVHVAAGVYSGGPVVTTHSGTSTQRIVYISDTLDSATVQLTTSGNCCVWVAHGLQVAIVGFTITQNVATVDCRSGTVCNGTSGLVLANGPNEWAIANRITNLHGAFSDNSCNGNGGGAITVPNAGGNFLIGNHLDHNGGICHFIHAIYMNSGNVAESNIVNNNQDGIACGNGCNNAVLSNNTVFNNGGQGLDCAGSNGTDCQGSTLTNFGACLPMTSGVSHTQITAQNNACVNNGAAGAFCDISNQGSAINTSRLVDNYIDNWASGNGVGSAKTSCINVNGGTGNTISGNVLTAAVNGIGFLNYQANGSGDYHLAAGSPAIATGTTACTGGSTISPCVPATDFSGIAFNSPISIGAYEFASGVTPTVTLLPASLNFGSVLVGATSSTQNATLTNTSTVAASISNVVASGDYAITASACGSTLAAGANCAVTLRFGPTATGTRNGTLTVTDNAVGSPHTVGLTGTGTAPAVTLSTASLSFGNQQITTTSLPQAVTLTNSGTGLLSISGITLVGTNPTDFGQTTTCGATLASGANCTFSIVFHPATLGGKTATLQITDSASGSPHTVALSGTGTGTAAITLSPPSLTFSGTNVGSTSASQPITLTNTGTGPVTINSITSSGDFSQTNNCSAATFSDTFSSGTLDPTKWVIDTGAAPGTIAGINTGTFSAGNVNMAQSVLELILTQTGAAPVISTGAEVRSLNTFGYGTYQWTARLGSTSTTPGGAGSAVTGQVSGLFNYFQNNGLTAPNFTEDDFEVEGQSPTALEMTSWTSSSPSVNTSTTVTEAGMASASHIYKFVWQPGRIDYYFDGALVSTHTTNVPTSPAFIIQNFWGTNSASFGGTATTGTTRHLYISGFSFTPIASTLAAGASCTINVSFTPTAPGTRTGAITVNDSAAGSPHTATLSGTGLQAAVTLTPPSMAFGLINVGATSASQTATLTNSGTQTLTISSIAVTGTNSGDFARVNGCGGTLAPGISCTVTVSFTPLAAGARVAALTVTDSAPGSPHTIAISGTGATQTVTLLPTSIAFGTQAVGGVSNAQTLTLTNTGTGTVTVSSIALTGTNANQFTIASTCGGSLLAGANCTVNVRFAPTTSGAKSASVTVTDTATGSPHISTLTGTGLTVAPGANISPTSLTFTSQTVGTLSAAQNVTLTNNGNATLNIASIAVSGDYQISANTCVSTLVASANCVVSVKFAPSAAGTRTGNLTFTDDAAGSPQIVPLTGTGTAVTAPIATINPLSLTFPNTTVGSTSLGQTVTLTNTGTAVLNITSILAAGDYLRTTTCGGTLAINAACTVSVTFNPSATGVRNGTLTFTNDAAGSPHVVTLTGTGIAPTFPVVSLSATSLAFGNITVGNTSVAQSVTLTNTGSATLNIASISLNNTTDFGETTTCASTLAAGASCTISATFHPTSIGARTGTISITNNAAGSPQTITLSGTGQSGVPIATVTPTSLVFAARLVGTTSGAQTVTVQNTGSASLVISSTSASGDFARTTACGTLIPGNSCVISVTFKPTAFGQRTGTLTINDNAGNTPQTVSLAGQGIGPIATFSPTSVSFGTVSVGATSAAQTVTLTNTGTASLLNIVISLTGTNVGDFSFTNAGGARCKATLAAGASCRVTVRFSPTVAGARSANLHFIDSASNSPQDVAMTGTGQASAPTVSLSATSLTFGSQQVSTTSASQTVTLTNSGTSVLTITSIIATGDYARSTTCGGTLAASATCTISVTFTPTTTGTRTGAVTLTDDASDSPQAITLTGTGTAAPAPTVSLSPTSLTFTSQQVGTTSASQTVTLSNIGSASLTITSITFTGTNAGDYTRTTTCTGSLAASSSCTIPVSFHPTAAGTRTASLSIVDNATGTPHTVPITGTAFVGSPGAVLSVNSLSFGSQPLQVPSTALPVTLTNNGTAPLLISSIVASGDFTESDNCTLSLSAGLSCVINVGFTPTQTGTRTGTLTITDNASSSPQSVALSGIGSGPVVVLNPTFITFTTSQVVGTTSSPARTFTISNTGNQTLSIVGMGFTGANPGDFSKTSNCPNSLAAGASCIVSLTFTPSAIGTRTATFNLTDDASDSPQLLSVTGTGIAGSPAVQLSPTSLNFGSIQQGSTTPTQTVTLKNVGTALLTISSITVAGTDAADFALVNGCGGTLAVNATCTFTVDFTPATTAAEVAHIAVADDAVGTPQLVNLSGTGTAAPAPRVSLSASALTFTAQQVGTPSASQTLTLTNTGDATLTITSINFGPPNAGDFSKTTTCGATLASAASCTVSVFFVPTAAGNRSATLVFTDNATDSPQTVSLTGTAFTGAPISTLSTTTLNFGTVTTLVASPPQTFTITNTGNASLLISSIVADSTFASGTNEYTQTNNCPASLAVNATCTVSVVFVPQVAGNRTGTVIVTSNSTGSPQTVNLTGFGQAPPPPPGTFVAVGIGGHSGLGGVSSFGVELAPDSGGGGPVTTYTTCTSTQAIPLPTTLPNMGNLIGAGTVVGDPEPLNGTTCFHLPIARLTDANSNPQSLNRTYQVSIGGSAEDNPFNIDSTLLFVADTGGAIIPMTFNPQTMQAARMYASSFPTTGGLRINDPSEFSSVSSQLLYTFLTPTNAPPSVVVRDLTNRVTPPAAVTVADFSTCLPGYIAKHSSTGGVGASDTIFAASYSTQGLQNTDTTIAVWKSGVGCRLLDTSTGVITGTWGSTGTVTSITERFGVHNVKMSLNGQTLFIQDGVCLSGTCTGPYFWDIATTTITPCPANCGGHSANGNTHWANDAGAPFSQKLLRPFSNLSAITPLLSVKPAGLVPPLDNHLSWVNAGTSDLTPFFMTSNDQGAHNPLIYGWENEVYAAGTSGTDQGRVWRFAHTYNSGLSHRFATSAAIGTVSQDGRFYMWSSDWMGTLGSEAGASTCTIGTNCRGDVFIVRLSTAPVPSSGNQEDLLTWATFANRTTQSLSGTYSYLDGDTPATANAGRKFWFIKNNTGGPGWDVNPYDDSNLYLWLTENGEQAPTNPSAYKRFVNFVPWAPRMYTLGTTITSTSPSPNLIKRTINCELDNQTPFDLGDIESTTSTIFAFPWGGSIGTKDTVLISYFWGGTAPNYSTLEEFWLVKNLGRVQWRTSHRSGSTYVADQTVTHTSIVNGSLVAPNFACGFTQPWWLASP